MVAGDETTPAAAALGERFDAALARSGFTGRGRNCGRVPDVGDA
jgi:hypothetical protein